MLVEPPRPGPPGRPPALTARLAPHALARVGLGAAAVTLGAASRGDALVLGLVLAACAAAPAASAAVVLALLAAVVRWGSTSLTAIAGAQSVLGPAGWTGSAASVASAWLAAAGLVAAGSAAAAAHPIERRVALGSTDPATTGGSAAWTTRRWQRWVVTTAVAAPFGVTAAAVVVGPGHGGGVVLRVVASVGLSTLAGPPLVARRWVGAAGLAAGALALLLAVLDRPTAWPTLDGIAGRTGHGLVVGTAAAAAAVVAWRGVGELRVDGGRRRGRWGAAPTPG